MTEDSSTLDRLEKQRLHDRLPAERCALEGNESWHLYSDQTERGGNTLAKRPVDPLSNSVKAYYFQSPFRHELRPLATKNSRPSLRRDTLIDSSGRLGVPLNLI